MEELPGSTAFVEVVHAETKVDLGAQIVDRIMNLKTDFCGRLKRCGWKEHVCPGGKWIDGYGKAAANEGDSGRTVAARFAHGGDELH